MPDRLGAGLSYREKAFFTHIIGRIGEDLQTKDGLSDLKVKQALDAIIIPSAFFAAYKTWPDSYREDVARAVRGEAPREPLTIMQRAYDNAFRLAEQRMDEIRAVQAAADPPAPPPPPPPSAPPSPVQHFRRGIIVGVLIVAAVVVGAYVMFHGR